MAIFHFQMKIDTKPDGTKVQATDHAAYNGREGKYKDIDERREKMLNRFIGNAIAASPEPEANSNQATILYKNKNGVIIENNNRIEPSNDSSMEILHAALLLASKKYGTTLSVTGSTEFKAKAIVAAIEIDLPIHFFDTAMETERQKLQEVKNNVGREIAKSRSDRNAISAILHQRDTEYNSFGTPTTGRTHLQTVSSCPVVQFPKNTELLLPDNASYFMADRQQKNSANRAMRWANTDRKLKAAEKIIASIQAKEKTSATDHIDYINRDADFAYKGGCIYQAHHLPKWADDSSKKFWTAAEAFEQTATVYREIELALPNELTLPQQIEIVNQFVENHLGSDFYWSLAVHDKYAAMGNGERNPHVHIMFSERKLDAIEKQNERIPECFFKKANRNHREKGGPNKDPKWNSEQRFAYLCEMRKDYAMIQNAILEKYGHDVRVDHRSLKAQREAALLRGDVKMAELLDRLPEKHLGPRVAAQKDHKDVIELQKYRAYKAEHRQLLLAADMLEAAIEKESLVQNISLAETQVKDLIQTEIPNTSSVQPLQDLKHNVLETLKEVSALEKIVIWRNQALVMAQKKFMSPTEQATYDQLKNAHKERQQLRQFKNSLPKPAGWDKDACAIHADLNIEIDRHDQEYEQISKQTGKTMQATFTRLGHPVLQKRIQAELRRILQEDQPAKDMLKDATERLSFLVPKLQAEVSKCLHEQAQLQIQNPASDRMTAQDVSIALHATIRNFDAEIMNRTTVLGKLSEQVISLPRAKEMAKDIFTKGAFKQLREQRRLLEKELPRIAAAKAEYQRTEAASRELIKPRWYQSKDTYNAELEKVAVMRNTIMQRENEYDTKTRAMDTEFKRLEDACDKPTTQNKITQIALGILKKNQPIAERFEAVSKQQTTSMNSRKELQGLQSTLREQIRVDRGRNITYQVKGNLPGAKAEIIAQAINGNRKMRPLVARFDNDDEIFDGMSELDRRLVKRNRDIKV